MVPVQPGTFFPFFVKYDFYLSHIDGSLEKLEDFACSDCDLWNIRQWRLLLHKLEAASQTDYVHLIVKLHKTELF